MPSKKPLILVVSERMDTNKKEDRDEHGLIRMSAVARGNMGFNQDTVELYSHKSTDDRIKSSMVLNIYQAYTADIRKVKALIADGVLGPEDILRVGFVTSRTYKRITGVDAGDTNVNVWITKDVEDTVIGADPEFLLLNADGRVVSATNTPGLSKTSKIGCDGAMAEVRPDPAVSPADLVRNIRAIFCSTQHTKPISNLKWQSGIYVKDTSRDYQLGGHIHLGNPARIAKLDGTVRERFFRVLNKILDELLALPMMKFDGPDGKKRRTSGVFRNYGYFGEYRLCDGRLEHRTLSGAWLSHPKLAELVFGTVKAIIDDVYGRVAAEGFKIEYMCPTKFNSVHILKPEFTDWAGIPLAADMNCLRSSGDMRKLLDNSSAQFVNKRYLDEWFNIMKGLASYDKYSQYIDALREVLARPAKDLQTINRDLKRTWVDGENFTLL